MLEIPETREEYDKVRTDQVDGHTFYCSEEFRALCKRFNIPWGLPTVGTMVVSIPFEGAVEVKHEYRATVRKEVPPPLDTTTVHNERWRTRKPPTKSDVPNVLSQEQ